MSIVPTPDEPSPTTEPAEVPTAPGFGVLTMADLANRADKAYEEHTQGYTASTVLHRLYLAEALDDEALRAALDLLFARLEAFHTTTRAAWRQAYGAWAAAAGVAPAPGDADGGQPGKPADLVAVDLPVDDDMAAPFADLDDGRDTDTDY